MLSSIEAKNELSEVILAETYKKLYRIRRVEEVISEKYPGDAIKSPVHLSIGQEAVAVGACNALKKDDFVANTYRCHAGYLAKGGCLKKMLAELYGKKDGCASGKAGSMHLVDIERGILGASAVVGTTIPISTGYAFALKREYERTGTQRVILSFFGDGATEEGSFVESINFACLHKLPIIYLCENNGYAIHNTLHRRWGNLNICEKAEAYGLPTKQVDSGDVFEIEEAVKASVDFARNGGGPIFVECLTYRYKEHVGPNEDLNEEYRDINIYNQWKAKDQVEKLAKQLLPENRFEIESGVEREIAEAIKYAEDSEFPGQEELLTHVYSIKEKETKSPLPSRDSSGRMLTYVSAIAEACIQEMRRDEDVFVFGLDVDDHKKIQGSTAGILEEFGSKRLFGTPLSEDAMTGVAVGAAIFGLKPIHVHIRMDFMLLAMNQIINMAAKSHYMYGGAIDVPMVVRTMVGRSWGQGAQHSQALHAIFAHIPGLRIVAPSSAYDAKGCMIAAIRDRNPVIFMEHRLLCNLTSKVPEVDYEMEIGKGRIVSEGTDITIVATSHMVIEAIRASKALAKLSISVEIIDPIWIKPLDMDLIYESVSKTGKLLIVDNAWLQCGLGSEIIAQMVEYQQKKVNAKEYFLMHRMGFAEAPCPTTRSLEDLFYPSWKSITQKAYSILNNGGVIDISDLKINQEEINQFKGPF